MSLVVLRADDVHGDQGNARLFRLVARQSQGSVVRYPQVHLEPMDYRFVDIDAFALLCRDLESVDQKLNWARYLVIIVGASSRIAHFWWVEFANRNSVLLCFISLVMGSAQSIR